MAAATNQDDSDSAPATSNQESRPQQTAIDSEQSVSQPPESEDDEEDEDDDDDDDDDDGEEEEPKLKYTRLTASLGPVYRNGDATSTFVVAGDKMVRRMPFTRRRAYTKFHIDCRHP